MFSCKNSHPVPQNLTLHLKLNQDHLNNPFLSSRPVIKLLSRGPNFGLMASPSSMKRNLLLDCNIFEYRVVSTLDRANRAGEINAAKEYSRSLGILDWKPCKIPYSPAFYARECRNMYQKDNQIYHSCPELQPNLVSLKASILRLCDQVIHSIASSKRFVRWGNIAPCERAALSKLKDMDLCYGLADKNLGPVLSSGDLVRKQLHLHLFDEAGTYREVLHRSKIEIIMEGIERLERLAITYPKFSSLISRFALYARWCAEKERLCKVFILWKLHKKPKDNGLESRLIAPNIDYFTADASTFLHYQLAPSVFGHSFVLKDSLSLCRTIDKINKKQFDWYDTRIVTADVIALYPSINIRDGLSALRWYLEEYTNFSRDFRFFLLFLAEFVLDNNFVEADGIGSGIFQQVIGVPMGTSFSVVFAIIFMLWIEMQIIGNYLEWIRLYKRAIDDIIIIWQGPDCEFEKLKHDFNNAHPNIHFDWGVLSKEAVFLDLNLFFRKVGDRTLFIESSVYCKPGNAFCYLQPDSFHPPHNFRGWIRGLLIRNITRSNTIDKWREENINLFNRLRARGHHQEFLLKVFREVCWGDRIRFLQSKTKNANDGKRIVLSTQYVPGFEVLKSLQPLNFAPFRNTHFTKNIFPSSGTWVAKAAPKLGCVLRNLKPKCN